LDGRQEKAGATSIGAQARQQRFSNENKVWLRRKEGLSQER
jgi:hypothetical protein